MLRLFTNDISTCVLSGTSLYITVLRDSKSDKSRREGRKLACLKKDLLVKFRQKEEMHRWWKQGCVA